MVIYKPNLPPPLVLIINVLQNIDFNTTTVIFKPASFFDEHNEKL